MFKRHPHHFYDLTHPKRWYDKFSTPQGEERLVLSPQELKERYERNMVYRTWLNSFSFMGKGISGKQMKWQAVQILSSNHSQNSSKDWWDSYQDCVFRVFLQPETRYSKYNKDWVQWYILCPEDSEMIMRERAWEKGITIPPRNALEGERFISKIPEARKLLMVPVECCRHFRHETTAGKVSEGL